MKSLQQLLHKFLIEITFKINNSNKCQINNLQIWSSILLNLAASFDLHGFAPLFSFLISYLWLRRKSIQLQCYHNFAFITCRSKRSDFAMLKGPRCKLVLRPFEWGREEETLGRRLGLMLLLLLTWCRYLVLLSCCCLFCQDSHPFFLNFSLLKKNHFIWTLHYFCCPVFSASTSALTFWRFDRSHDINAWLN